MSSDSTHKHFYNKSNHQITYTQNDLYFDSIFALNDMHTYSVHIYTHTIHDELKILFHVLPLLNQIL